MREMYFKSHIKLNIFVSYNNNHSGLGAISNNNICL